VAEGAPLVRGGLCGNAGCVGEATGEEIVADGAGETGLEGVEAAVGPPGASASHAANSRAAAMNAADTEDGRIGLSRSRGGIAPEDTVTAFL
jgi:hypothetical protein